MQFIRLTFNKTLTLPQPFALSPISSSSYRQQRHTYWFHPDHTSATLITGLGSSSYISNINGRISQHIEYFPFGETLVEEHKNSNNSPYKFNGKMLDAETGNYYYGARYYNPKWGLWLSVDPLAEKYPSLSPYSYTANNPIKYIDIEGKCFQKAGDYYVPCDESEAGTTTTGAFGYSWTMTRSNGWQLTNGADPSQVHYEYDYIKPTGKASYYVKRYINHLEKYNTRPPDYYLEYGYNNRVSFGKIRSSMTKVGKGVFDNIAVGLQRAMNEGVRLNPEMQGDNSTFHKFAYGSHFSVYLNSGIGRLKGDDLMLMLRGAGFDDTFGSPEGRGLMLKLLPHLFSEGRNYPKGYWNPNTNPGNVLITPGLKW